MHSKLFLVVNEDRFFLSHRREIALRAVQEGYDVTVVCKDTGQRSDIEDIGLHMLDLPINPTGEKPVQELHTMRFLYRLYRRERPDIVHHVGLKNILWGGLAARLARIGGVVNAVSGLGTLFIGDRLSIKARAILLVLRLSNRSHNVVTIFQNHDDEQLFLNYKIVRPEQCVFIKGSGVNLNEYSFSPEP